MLNRLIPAAFSRRAQPPAMASASTTRIRLAPGMGDTVAIEGRTFTADADGMLEVPHDVAAALQPHLPRERAALPAEVGAVLATLQDKRAALAEVAAQISELEAAKQRADVEFAAGAAVPAPARSLAQVAADFLTGKAKQRDVDQAQQQHEAAEAARQQQERARALATAAREELQLQIDQLERDTVGPLRAEIARLGTWAVRLAAEAAARRLRDAADAYAGAFADVQAHAVLLAGTDQKFNGYVGNAVALPVFPGLAAFDGHIESITGPVLEIPLALREAQARVREQLAAAGINP